DNWPIHRSLPDSPGGTSWRLSAPVPAQFPHTAAPSGYTVKLGLRGGDDPRSPQREEDRSNQRLSRETRTSHCRPQLPHEAPPGPARLRGEREERLRVALNRERPHRPYNRWGQVAKAATLEDYDRRRAANRRTAPRPSN